MIIRIVTAILFVAILVSIVAYARGYRLDVSSTAITSTGLVAVTSTPRTAKVYVNSELKGITDLSLNLAPGTYFIKDGALEIRGGGVVNGSGVTIVFTGNANSILYVIANGSLNIKAAAKGPFAGIAIAQHPMVIPSTKYSNTVIGGGQLGLYVSWPDATQDRLSPDDTVSFGDAVAMQLPTRFGAGERLPHVAMGDDTSPVRLLMQRAVVGGAQSSRFVAAGFGSLTRTGAAQPSSSMRYDVGAKRWSAVFLRPLVEEGHAIDAALVPVAFAVWDGAGRQRGGAKSLSPWKFLRRASLVADSKYVESLSWGFGTTPDVAKGKALVGGICIACHRFADKRFAPEGLAPGLDTIGAIAAPSYLRDSIMDPSLVVVMHPNPNRHYNKGAPTDPNGAFPNNPAFEWSTLDPAGKKLSKMPPFAAFPPDDIAAMVAYLRTLDGSRSTP